MSTTSPPKWGSGELLPLPARFNSAVRALTAQRFAETLCLADDSVKKYVSRILAATGCQSRMERALLARSRS